ncbi:TPA: hypothetical protein JBI62_00840 [Legionella pneumophila]|nr:hypothetical protein [Legionella pneumophila]
MSKTRVFVDTNIILESFRINSWKAICNNYAIETVDKCIEEALSGDPDDPQHISIKHEELTNGLSGRYNPTKKDITSLIIDYPQTQGIDDGELHLFAWLYAQKLLPSALILISTADKAAIKSTGLLGWLDSVTSLEYLLNTAGVAKQQNHKLKAHYRTDWLNKIKTQIKLELM